MKKIKLCNILFFCIFILFGCSSQLNADSLFVEKKEGIIYLQNQDLSKYDLRKYEEELFNSNFNTKTIWPEKLPKRFDYKKLLELGKDPGMGIYTLHKKGITGKGIGIAIIDQPLLEEHIEYKDRLKFYYIDEDENKQPSFHGAAVASLAVGKNIGTAPMADLYYFAIVSTKLTEEEFYTKIANNIYQIIELNKTLENKIRVISISRGFSLSENYDIVLKAINEAKKHQIEVITADIYDENDLIGLPLQRKIYEDPNKVTSYLPWHTSKEYYYIGDKLSIPTESRTVASFTGVNEYEYTAVSGVSWSMPYLAGIYSLALQVNPELNLEDFLEIALETSENNKGINVISPCKIIEYLLKN